ncbi:MAG: peptidylprolyl isomerase [Pyrinomonadaceae bacterium]|nr:peptidylprolyl isomerase [Pyrinomonadaceae bacterium]
MDSKAINIWLLLSRNPAQKASSAVVILLLATFGVVTLAAATSAQTPAPGPQTPTDAAKKANARPGDAATPPPQPFDGASPDKMATQCVTLETEAGPIEIEMMPEVAPESVRSFLNLGATGALDTTTFSRVVKGFIIQGGNLSTSEKWGVELSKRAARKVPDEPGPIKHLRGIVSMARTVEPNSDSTHFFILVGDGQHLNSKFAAFGRVRKGIEVADAINGAQTEGDKPLKAVRINRAVVVDCVK